MNPSPNIRRYVRIPLHHFCCHTVEEKEDRGSYHTMDGTRYELAQFHFHSPSEHTVDGKHAAMEMHLVHKSEANEVAVLAVLIEPGAEDNAAFAQVWAGGKNEDPGNLEPKWQPMRTNILTQHYFASIEGAAAPFVNIGNQAI